MKLKNKITGQVIEAQFGNSNYPTDAIVLIVDHKPEYKYPSIKDFNLVWEDLPEELKPWGENVEVKELECGLKITMEDYWEIDEDGNKKTEFTFDEALKIEKKTNGKWRVPTIKEWFQIVVELGTTEDGNLDRDKFVKELNLAEDEDGYGGYWSSTVNSSINAYYLYYLSGELYPANRGFRVGEKSVRLVKGDGRKNVLA